MYSRDKVDAVYELRDAVAEKTRLEAEVEAHPSMRMKDRLLAATLNVETRTQRAIEACHACGRPHRDDADACEGDSNVVAVDFKARSANQAP